MIIILSPLRHLVTVGGSHLTCYLLKRAMKVEERPAVSGSSSQSPKSQKSQTAKGGGRASPDPAAASTRYYGVPSSTLLYP